MARSLVILLLGAMILGPGVAVGQSVVVSHSVDVSNLLSCATTNSVLQGGATPACTATPTISSLTLSTPLGAASGGVGLASYTVGDLLYASGATTLARLADVATGRVLASGGVGVAPAWSATPTVTSLTAATVIGGTGTTSPLALRSTSGVGTAGADIVFQVGNNGATEAMRVLNSGNVGIGVVGPLSPLEINGNVAFDDISLSASDATHAGVFSGVSPVTSSAGSLFFGIKGAHYVWFMDSASNLGTLTPAGDNTANLGANNRRVQSGYFGTSILLGSTLTWSSAIPTIFSGFGTTPSVTMGTATAFRINVGTGGTATSGVVAMNATATNGWNCTVNNLTAAAGNRADNTRQTASTTTTVSVQNQTTSTGAAVAWAASDVLTLMCTAL